ncbi:VanZ family protein [Halorussus salilacus]|uniref:VanZ family protein n=1 Tax=Halorussus salilacus TaxID=2953750 RepID=UPI0020A0A0DC|nr:VanZ family protein [Halorussus salilacus]USZ67337.1 VanZ family protein [Halorussus salilacus]
MNVDGFEPPGWVRWLGVAVVAGVICYSSLIEPPSAGIPSTGPFGLVGIDKWLHLLAYAGLVGSLAYALATRRDPASAATAALAVLLAFAYGIGIEFGQAVVPTRAFSTGDIAANAVGVALGAVCWHLLVGVAERVGVDLSAT